MWARRHYLLKLTGPRGRTVTCPRAAGTEGEGRWRSVPRRRTWAECSLARDVRRSRQRSHARPRELQAQGMGATSIAGVGSPQVRGSCTTCWRAGHLRCHLASEQFWLWRAEEVARPPGIGRCCSTWNHGAGWPKTTQSLPGLSLVSVGIKVPLGSHEQLKIGLSGARLRSQRPEG